MLAADANAQWLGMRRHEPRGGSMATFSMTPRPDHLNFLGGVHGGVVFSFADSAMGFASNAAGETAVAIRAQISYTAPAVVGEEISCDVIEVTRSRTLATYQVVVRRADGRIVASFDGMTYLRGD